MPPGEQLYLWESNNKTGKYTHSCRVVIKLLAFFCEILNLATVPVDRATDGDRQRQCASIVLLWWVYQDAGNRFFVVAMFPKICRRWMPSFAGYLCRRQRDPYRGFNLKAIWGETSIYSIQVTLPILTINIYWYGLSYWFDDVVLQNAIIKT